MLKVISTSSELMNSKDQWNELVGKDGFKRWEWVTSWVSTLEQDTKPLVLVSVDESGAWKGIAPFCRQRSITMSKRVRFMGTGKACSDYNNLICHASFEDEFIAEVVDFLSQMAKGNTEFAAFNLLELDGVNIKDMRLSKFLNQLNDAGYSQVELPLEGSWVAELPGSFEEYFQSFSKSMRRKVKEAGKRLDHEDTRILSAANEPFESLWETFVELHQQRREMLGQPGCFADSSFAQFLRNSCQQMLDAGMADLTVIENSGSALAASLSLFSNDRWMLYQTGFDVNRQRESPGYQIVLQAVRMAYENNFKVFDLLRGDEPYKSRWKTERTALAKLRIIPPTSVALVRNNLWNSAKSIKTLTRQFTSLQS